MRLKNLVGANTCCFRRFTGQVLCLHLLLHSENVEKKDTQCADFLHEFRSKMGISWAKNEKKLVWKMKVILKMFFRLPQYA